METLPTTDLVREKTYDKKVVVINSDYVDTTSTSAFTYRLTTPLRDVVAVRLLAVELEADVGQELTQGDVYVAVNDYNLVYADYNKSGVRSTIYGFSFVNISSFGSTDPVLTFTVKNDSPLIDFATDPHTYVLDPVLGSLDRFDVKFFDGTGDIYDTKNAIVRLKLAVYMKRNKFSRI